VSLGEASCEGMIGVIDIVPPSSSTIFFPHSGSVYIAHPELYGGVKTASCYERRYAVAIGVTPVSELICTFE
jgi:hypothetical protein